MSESLKQKIDSEILQFINGFKKYNPLAIEESFTNGNCYWFAVILCERFFKYEPIIVYNQIPGHFMTKINESYYDITGNCNEAYDHSKSYDFFGWDDNSVRERIQSDLYTR